MECERCGRTLAARQSYATGQCLGPGADAACAEVHAAFLRGAAWMLETARRGAAIVGPECDRHIGWSGPEAALEARGR